MKKRICVECGKYPSEYAQTVCEFCMGITNKDDYIEQLQQEKEDLIKWLEDEDEKLWATATDGHRFIKNISLIERRTTLREILSKLKESDKNE